MMQKVKLWQASNMQSTQIPSLHLNQPSYTEGYPIVYR